nr:BMC domain-containing protein [Neiella litorisoli]
MIEFNSIAMGIETADHMLKSASVNPLMMKTICPGKYLVAVHGDVSSVQSAVDAGLELAQSAMVDYLVIPNIEPAVVSAMSGTNASEITSTLGIIETFSVTSAILAADSAVKNSDVDLIEVRIAMGLGGKAFFTLTGDLSNVEAAINNAAEVVANNGMLVRKSVIASLSAELKPYI